MVADPPKLTESALRQGHFVRKVLRNQEWLLRRTEAVRLRSAHEYQRQVVLTIDHRILREYQRECGGLFGDSVVPVPLMIVRKQLLLDFVVKDNFGNRLSTLTSDEDSTFACLAMIAELTQNNVSVGRISLFVTSCRKRGLNGSL